MKYTTEYYSVLLNGQLPCSQLEFEIADRLIDELIKNDTWQNLHIDCVMPSGFDIQGRYFPHKDVGLINSLISDH